MNFSQSFYTTNKLRNIFRTLRDSESITLMDKSQDLLYDLINKVPSDKPVIIKRIYGWTSYLQKYGVEKPATYIMESPVRTLTDKEKLIIFKSSEELKKALTEIMKDVGIPREPTIRPPKLASIEKEIATAGEAPGWPTFRGTAKFVGTSPSGRVTVYADSALGKPAEQNAQDLVNDADRIVTANDTFFGFEGGKVSVIIFAIYGATDGTGGATHMGCDFNTGAKIEVCSSFDNSARVSALFEAMLSECSMGGSLCSLSTGEALSRWCAAMISNNALADFTTAPTWVQDGMQNYVDQTADTDLDYRSTGCGMAFISWLMSKGYWLDQIAQAMVKLGDSGTLAQLYANLTSDDATNAWLKFQGDVLALPNGVTNDDPFGAATQPMYSQSRQFYPKNRKIN